MIKGVIFDFHGTLAFKSKSVDVQKLCEFLRKDGYDVYHQEWTAAYKFVFFVEYPKGKIKSYEDYFKRVFGLLGIKPTVAAVKKVANYFRENERFELYPDVESVRKLGVKKAVLTTTPDFKFGYLDLAGFDPVMTGKEIGKAKPHPNGFLKILKIWKMKPSEVLMVGDEADLDIIPAKLLGIKTAFVGRENQVCGEADYNISSLKGLLKII